MKKLLLILLVAVLSLPIMANKEKKDHDFRGAIISHVDENTNFNEMSEKELMHFMFRNSFVIAPVSVTPQDTIRIQDPKLLKEKLSEGLYDKEGNLIQFESRRMKNRAVSQRLRELQRTERILPPDEYRTLRREIRLERRRTRIQDPNCPYYQMRMERRYPMRRYKK